MTEDLHPRWPWLVGSLTSVAGLAAAAYLTYEHYSGSSSLVCSDKGIVNCLKVTTSSYSRLAGLPVSVLGLVFFAVMFALQLPPTWNRSEPAIRIARVTWAAAGLATAVYLFYAELFRINAICLWCTTVHVLTFILFVSTVSATLTTAPLDHSYDDLREQDRDAKARG